MRGMPWRISPAGRLQIAMKIQAWRKACTAAAPVAVPSTATRHDTPSANPICRHMA